MSELAFIQVISMFAQVLLYTNQNYQEMLDTAALMGNLVKESTKIAMFIYAGHRKGEMWETLLCPVDITPSKGRVPARLFQESLRKAKIGVLAFECCRTKDRCLDPSMKNLYVAFTW